MPERRMAPEGATLLYEIEGAAFFSLPDGRVLRVLEDGPPMIVRLDGSATPFDDPA